MANPQMVTPPEVVSSVEPEPSRAFRTAVKILLRHPLSVVGAGILLLFILFAILAPWLTPYQPLQIDPMVINQPPESGHWLGTDQYGHDILTRILFGARFDLAIGFIAVTVSLVTGVTIGAIAGYRGGWWDEIMMRIMDILESFPRFIFAMAIAYGLGPGLWTVIIATATLNVPGYARQMRGLMYSAKRSTYASAAVCVGNRAGRLLFRHLVPNCMGPVLVVSTLQAGWSILDAAGLSFLGLGIRVPQPEWGVMISMGLQTFLQGAWWTYLFPGVAIMIIVLAFNFLGDALQDILDPRRRI